MAATASVLARLGGLAQERASWIELGKFALVGGSGYLINLAVFAVLVGDLGVQHTPAAMPFKFLGYKLWTFAR